MDVPSNVFCSSGMHLPNGSFATFGGNGAVGPGGNLGSNLNPGGWTASWDATYQDFDGSRAIRILDPCRSADDMDARACQWFDDASVLAMKAPRWYSTAEPLADGTVVMIGGFTTGGYINRNYPNDNPDSPGSQNTYEFFPARDGDPIHLPFLTKTSGLNTYVNAFLMPSGRMFLQANVSSTLWDYEANEETDLPDMPHGVVRVYPASGAVAMLPLTPENDYNPTILFCGGTDMNDEQWGDYSYPYINTWDYPASKDCQRITPEPSDGSAAAYEQDDDMPEGRTLTQFIILPDGKLFLVNGAINGTAGYAQRTRLVESYADMPFGESLASGPVLTPAIYDPNAPLGERWSQAGLKPAKHPRMYHSSAMLLPDASVLIAGSNPNVDVNLTTIYPTTYEAEIFYPPYFSASVRPGPTGIPSTLSYGGEPFDVTIDAASYSGDANKAAEGAIVAVVRGGFTTHSLNMGQRFLQLKHTFTVAKDGALTLHVAQMPPTPGPAVFQPGPAFVHVTINGIPSNGTYVIVGSGAMGAQPLADESVLPASVRAEGAKGGAKGSATSIKGGDDDDDDDDDDSEEVESAGGLGTGAIIGIAAGGGALFLAAAIGAFIFLRKRRAGPPATAGSYNTVSTNQVGAFGISARTHNDADSIAFEPLKNSNNSSASFNPYSDNPQSYPYTSSNQAYGNQGYQGRQY